MIHDNFKKLVRRWICSGAVQGDTNVRPSNIYDFTDFEGYTGKSSDTKSTLLSYQYIINGRDLADYTFDNILTKKGGTALNSSDIAFFAVIGNSIENEPDYCLGSLITDDYLKVTTIKSAVSEILHTTVINNTSDNEVTFNEIGFALHCGYTGTNAGSVWNGARTNTPNFLLIKEVLPEPMTIPANSSINITFNLFGDTPVVVTPSE